MSKLKAFLFKPADSRFLGVFRILFGIVMFFEFKDFYFYLSGDIQNSKFLFTYDYFHWIKLLDIDSLAILYIILFIALLFFILGLYYRIAAIIIFLGHSYGYLVDIGHYNNHYYFYCLVLFWFTITNANQSFSIDKILGKTPNNNQIPKWQILGFQLQVFVVYFMGGIAKLNYDWLNAFPMRLWIYNSSSNFSGWLQEFLQSKTAAYIISYSGILLDLSIGFLIFFKRSKFLALIPILIFHISNHFLWSIGTFPWAMIAISIIFFYPSDFSKNYNKRTEQFSNTNSNINLVSIFFILWFCLQFFIPLRHIAYKGNPSWTGEGHFFAWRMMLVDISASIKIDIIDPDTNITTPVDIESFLSKRQLKKVIRSPKDLLRFCQFLKEDYENVTSTTNQSIRLEFWKSINERTPLLLNDTSLNYGNKDIMKNNEWILPWSPTTDELKFTLKQYENWDEFFEKNPNQNLYY